MNFNEALLSKLDKIIEKIESLENVVTNLDLKVQKITNTNESNEIFGITNNNNITLSSSSSAGKLDSDHWTMSTDLKYRQGITPDQRRRENRQNNLYRSSSPSQGSGLTLRQVPPYTQTDIRRTTKPSRPSSTENNSKPNITNNTFNANNNNNNANDKKKLMLTPQKVENKPETPPQQQIPSPAKSRGSVVFFPDDNEDDLQFDED